MYYLYYRVENYEPRSLNTELTLLIYYTLRVESTYWKFYVGVPQTTKCNYLETFYFQRMTIK